MSTAEAAYLTVGGIGVDVVRKDIKNLHIGVYPPVGRVRVAAPRQMGMEQIRLAVVKRLPWIKSAQQRLRDADRQTEREMLNGESHYIWGRRLRLQIVEQPGAARVEVRGQRLVLRMPAGMSAEGRVRVIERYYRGELRCRIADLIEEWLPVIDRPVNGWTVRRMRTKWGSCNPESGRLSFNMELAKKPPRCVEYIVVHELAHLRERGHGERFVALMDELLPDWRSRRDELNTAPLAAEEWPTAGC